MSSFWKEMSRPLFGRLSSAFCSAPRSSSLSEPRTEISMQAFAARSSTPSRGGRPVRRRMASMFSPKRKITAVTSAICRAVTVRPSRVTM